MHRRRVNYLRSVGYESSQTAQQQQQQHQWRTEQTEDCIIHHNMADVKRSTSKAGAAAAPDALDNLRAAIGARYALYHNPPFSHMRQRLTMIPMTASRSRR